MSLTETYKLVPCNAVYCNANITGGEARLPCPLAPAQPGDSVYLVLWYKKDDKTPIYSYDSR